MILDDDRVRYVGMVGYDQRSKVLGGAVSLLHLVSVDEAFGFGVVEAMACGTPRIATRCGSMPEIVEPNVSGLLVDSVDGAPEAVARALLLDSQRVRQHVVSTFNRDRMVKGYLDLYSGLVGRR